MDFKSERPIYLQIVDLCHERIMSGQWQEGERVPSVRELGHELTVNAHTALKAYDVLQAECIIEQRRGLGYFLVSDARKRVGEARCKEFIEVTLPVMFAEMDTFGVSIDTVLDAYKRYRDRQADI